MDPLARVASATELPDADALVAVLRRWQRGELELDDVRAWAAALVDRHVLPDVPGDHPDAARVEVLLELSGTLPLTRDDVPALVALVAASPEHRGAAWRAWYTRVEETADARRPRKPP